MEGTQIEQVLSAVEIGEGGLREFPSVCREEEMDGAIVHLGLRAQVRVDQFTDRCAAVLETLSTTHDEMTRETALTHRGTC